MAIAEIVCFFPPAPVKIKEKLSEELPANKGFPLPIPKYGGKLLE